MSNVLVMFQADTEHTEQMALAVGVGAVEAEASIRLRRLAAPGAVEVAHKGYGKLQAADLLWANTIVIGLESPTPKPEELRRLVLTESSCCWSRVAFWERLSETCARNASTVRLMRCGRSGCPRAAYSVQRGSVIIFIFKR